MGSRPKPQQTSYYQQTTQSAPPEPTMFVTYTPTKDLKALAANVKENKEEAEQLRQFRFKTLGTDADRAARSAGRDAQAAASYLSSLPAGASAARGQAETGLSQARQDYADALRVAETTPAPTAREWELPVWAMSSKEYRAFKKTEQGKELNPQIKKGKFVDESRFS